MARTRIADAASALTLRGRCLVAAGVTLALLGALLGERGLLQLALGGQRVVAGHSAGDLLDLAGDGGEQSLAGFVGGLGHGDS